MQVDSYLDYRKRFGDPLRKNDPLIRQDFDIYDLIRAATPLPLKHTGIVDAMKELIKRSGFSTKSEVMRSHGFRKFTITQMIKAKVDYTTREYLVGPKHSRGLDVHYDRSSEEDRLSEYLKAVSLLGTLVYIWGMDGSKVDQKWAHITIELDLAREVDQIVREAHTTHGARKYFSRADFTRDAILRLIGEYRNPTTKQSKTQKRRGEEILVAGK